MMAMTILSVAGAAESYPWLDAVSRQAADSLIDRHPTNSGFTRISVESGSFAKFLRALPLKPKGTPLRTYDGDRLVFAVYAGAIINLDVGKADLQQCADTLIRLYSEHQYSKGKASGLNFKFTSGHAYPFADYLAGKRPVVTGRQVNWRQVSPRTLSRKAFRQWLDIIFTYAGTASLARDLPKVKVSEARIGDLFISPGFPGHTVMIADMAVNSKTGAREVLLVEGFTPAQDAHVIKNLLKPWRGSWFTLVPGEGLDTPVWDFAASELHRMP